MSRTFRDRELRIQKREQTQRWINRRQRSIDTFCSYLLGTLDEEGQHASACEPEDRAIRHARRILNGEG